MSLDTLNPEKFARIRRRGDLAKVPVGLFAAKRCGLHPIKINAVIERGVNDDDILDLVEFSRKNGFVIRFIEFMPSSKGSWRTGSMRIFMGPISTNTVAWPSSVTPILPTPGVIFLPSCTPCQ